MSEENMEAARQTLEAFDRRDRAAWLATRDDQDYEVVTDRYWPEADSIRGREAAWEFYVKVAEAFEQLPAGDAGLVDAGADKVLVHQRSDVRGRTSGVEVELNYWVVITFREGRIVREQWFADRNEALEAAGLAE
jgi:ketosteroid isomerase-like protein